MNDSSNKIINIVGGAPTYTASMILALSAGMGAGIGPPPKKMQVRKLKTCLYLNCNIEHTHNNSFCSAECCKAHKGDK